MQLLQLLPCDVAAEGAAVAFCFCFDEAKNSTAADAAGCLLPTGWSFPGGLAADWKFVELCGMSASALANHHVQGNNLLP